MTIIPQEATVIAYRSRKFRLRMAPGIAAKLMNSTAAAQTVRFSSWSSVGCVLLTSTLYDHDSYDNDVRVRV